MAILKCKMCGGDILLSEDKTTGTCDHCGSTMTFPRVSDEQKLNLYNRANHFRRQNEFDKAITAYERILDQDDTDAEAHWGAVLSRYGIEYVEDPVTHERIPTCHRVQIASILSDGDYLAALENAPDTASRDLYEQEAHRIAEIQKGILSISSQEKPYDVFICYKETDDSGSRTKDSTLAQEIYYQLTNEGYKVFFSRITLEDKLGQQYEPYIFAALNSAKVMLVIGTKPEYFNAVWVKNEWSRYLALMKNDRSRLLIPCYRDMDAYDLPDDLSGFQSQDMSKIGFVQDLIRGVKKVLENKKQEEVKPTVPQVVSSGANIENLMKRAWLFMEDGDFKSANEYLDKVLDEDAEYAPAYAGKVCTAFGFHKESDLAEATFLYAEHPDWKKALRFASSQQRSVYEGYYEQVKARVDRQIRDYAYDCAIEMAVNPKADREKLNREWEQYKAACATFGGSRVDGSRRRNAYENENFFQRAVKENEPGDVTEQGYQIAADMFRAIDGEKASACAETCLNLAEQARKKAVYRQAADKSIQSLSASGYDAVAAQFLTVANYKDAMERADMCRSQAETIRKDLYDTAIKAMNEAGTESNKWKQAQEKLDNSDLNDYSDILALRRKAEQRYQQCFDAEEQAKRCETERRTREAARATAKKKRIRILMIILIVLGIAAYFAITKYILPKRHYDKGVSLRSTGQWDEAVAEFKQADSYNDAATQILATRYVEGEAKRGKKDWEGAVQAFEQAEGYNDAISQISATRYAEAEAKRAAQDWDGAVKAFEQAGSYSDAVTQIKETRYQQAEVLESSGNSNDASVLFASISGYKDAYERAYKPYYDLGMKKRAVQDWEGAVQAFEKAGSYSDAATQIKETRYQQAVMLEKNDCQDEASALFAHISDYKDAYERAYKPYYNKGIEMLAVKDWDAAIKAFTKAEKYNDAETKVLSTYYFEGKEKRAIFDWEGAIEAFMQAGKYSDAEEQLNETVYQYGLDCLKNQKINTARWQFMKVYSYKDSATQLKLIKHSYDDRISASYLNTIGLCSDGTVIALGNNTFGQCDTDNWTDIVAVAAGSDHTVGLHADGTVVAVGYYSYGRCSTSSWSGIVAVAAGNEHTVGLRANGKVVAVGGSTNGECNTSSWSNIVAVAAGGKHTVGICSDGSVVASGSSSAYGSNKIQHWKDIIAISAGYEYTVGLRSDGTVVALGENSKGQCNTSNWSDIVAVAAGSSHTVGLRADGTVVAVGDNSFGQCDTENWTDIVAVAAGGYHTVGLRADGTVVTVGYKGAGQCNVSDWNLLK